MEIIRRLHYLDINLQIYIIPIYIQSIFFIYSLVILFVVIFIVTNQVTPFSLIHSKATKKYYIIYKQMNERVSL